jgi:hypothetical protein
MNESKPLELRKVMAWLGSHSTPAKTAAVRANARKPRPGARKSKLPGSAKRLAKVVDNT